MTRPAQAARRAILLLVAVASLGTSTAPAAPAAPAADASFPLGEGRVVTSGPRQGMAYSCATPVRSAAPAPLPWVSAGRWIPSRRPVVDGRAEWPAARLATSDGGLAMLFEGNGMPTVGATGVFAPGATDDAAPYASRSAALAEHRVRGRYAKSPRVLRAPRCIDRAVPIAIGTNGIPILSSFDAGGHDLHARDVTDRCGGRTSSDGLYYYRGASPCRGRRSSGREHSGLVGWARDGFPLYGPRGAGGVPLRSDDLDACHGHTHRVSIAGRKRSLYHYHATPDFPYAIGCFRGRPAAGWSITRRAVPPAVEPGAPAPVPPAPPPPGLDQAQVAAAPGLFPAFDADVSDYVVRCDGDPVNVTASSHAGLTVAIDGGTARSGDQAAPVDIDPGEAFAVAVANRVETRTFHVRCLPPDFPEWTVERPGTPQAEWLLVTPANSPKSFPRSYAAVFDRDGVPVWWIDDDVSLPINLSLLDNGNLSFARIRFGASFGNDDALMYEEHRLDGSLAARHRTVGSPTDPHDLEFLPNGNALLLAYRPRDHVDLSAYGAPADATVVDSEVQELEPDGDLVWSWSSKDHIAIEEGSRWFFLTAQLPDGRTAYDLTHINSVEPDGDGLVISLRNTDAVYRIDRATGAVTWKLGGTATPESLTFVDDPHGDASFGGQHDARVLADGTLTVNDNGSARPRGPRAVRYRIDAVLRTATMVEDVRDADTVSSFCCGGARRLPGGHWVAAWGGGTFMVGEYEPDGDPVLRLVFTDRFSYRANPVEPGRLSAAALRAGMDAMNPR